MQTYTEQAEKIACESNIAVMVLLNPDSTDMEMVMVRPTHDVSKMPSREEFARRQLRAVGVVGVNGLKPMSAFREPLETAVIHRISAAFLAYLRVLLGESFTQQCEAAELERYYARLYSLPDTN